MSTIITIRFLWGRYHGTAWNRAVNEGEPEWPPSPWRLARAVVSAWHERSPSIDPSIVERCLDVLADPPSFLLPSSSSLVTRHYLPDENHRAGITGATDKVLDAAICTSPDAKVLTLFPSDLDVSDRDVFRRLLRLVPYLGRAESICDMDLADEAPGCGDWLEPSSGDIAVRQVLVPTRPVTLAELQVRPQIVRQQGRRIPSGARLVEYADFRKTPATVSAAPTRRPVSTVRFGLTGPALPARSAALTMGEVLRRAAMSGFGRRSSGAASPLLAGKHSDGTPLNGQHGHAHYLAFDEDGDGLLDHLVVWAPGVDGSVGLGDADLAALVALQELGGHSYLREFRPVHLGIESVGQNDALGTFITGPSAIWTSHTPFVPARFRKRVSVEEHIDGEVRRELRFRGFPNPGSVERLPSGHWLSFRRHRLRERLEEARTGFGVRISFPELVNGPIALGRHSHFGLGLFTPFHG